MPKYPHIEVQLTGEPDNGFLIISRVVREMKSAGVPPEERSAFQEEAVSGDYDQLLQTVMEWVTVL